MSGKFHLAEACQETERTAAGLERPSEVEVAQHSYSQELALVRTGRNMEGKKLVGAEFSPGTRVPSSDPKHHTESCKCNP